MFDAPALSYDELDLDPGVRARFLTPDAALVDYLETHGMRRISKRLIASGALDVVATAVPGMKDILVLGKVKSLDEIARRRPDHRRRARGRPRDLVPALAARAARRGARRADPQAGRRRRRAALRSRALPGDARDAARGDAGERGDRDRVRDRRPRRCRARARDREPVLRAAPRRRHRVARRRARATRRRAGASSPSARRTTSRTRPSSAPSGTRCSTSRSTRLGDRLPLPQIELPFLFTPDIGRPQVDALAGALARGIEAL